jgi:hypothetical protein
MFALAFADEVTSDSAATPVPVLGQMPPSANDSIFSVINAGFEKIKPAFERSCYDCHSDQTHYPWYHSLPIIKGLIDSDIKAGRHHVDFSKGFPFAGKGTQAEMLTDIRNEIAEGEMPIMAYRLMHWGRLIEPPLQDTVLAWIDSSLARLASAGIVAPDNSAGIKESEKD